MLKYYKELRSGRSLYQDIAINNIDKSDRGNIEQILKVKVNSLENEPLAP